jgi:hypothetical protein
MCEEPQSPSVSLTVASYLRDRQLRRDFEQRQRDIAVDETAQKQLIFNPFIATIGVNIDEQ